MRVGLITLAAVVLVGAMILVRVSPLTLSGIDGACYARIAADLASRPLTTWADVQWMHGAFYEHPPLGLWLEGLWFTLFGSTAAAAVWLARLYAALLTGVVWWAARAHVGSAEAAFSIVGLATLASFQRETQNPMLEAPMMLACALALACCVRLPTSRACAVGFAFAATAAFWIKGIVGGALVVGLLWAWWRGATSRRVLLTLGLCAGLVILSVTLFEALRSAQGLEPYFSPYLRKQVAVAALEGRYSHDANPWYHLPTLVRWHLAALLALPLVAWRWRHQRAEWKQLVVLGVGWLVAIVVPFSLAQQKSEWHLNVLIPGAAWLIGAALAALPAPVLRFAPAALFAAAIGWGVLESRGPSPQNFRQAAINVLTTTPAALAGATVANCSAISAWPAQHLFAFHWNGTAVGCEDPAPWRFDGAALQKQ